MKRVTYVLGAMAVVLTAALATGQAGAQDEAESIKSLMGKLHKGADSPLIQLKKQLKAQPLDWEKIQDETKDLVILGASLSKFDPPKGNPKSYRMLANTYYQNAKNLDDAAQKQDAKAANAAFAKLSSSCMECHKAHKGK